MRTCWMIRNDEELGKLNFNTVLCSNGIQTTRPWTIRPRQLAPDLQTTKPLVLLSTTEPNTYKNYPTREATSFICCVQQWWLPGKNILTMFSSIELDGVLFIFSSSFVGEKWLQHSCWNHSWSCLATLTFPTATDYNVDNVQLVEPARKELTPGPTWLQIQGENNAIFETHFPNTTMVLDKDFRLFYTSEPTM